MLDNLVKNLDELENIINYSFKNKELLVEALTHNSYSNENNLTYNYERLEFLGDSVLQLIISDYILKNFSGFAEGEMSQLRAYLVSEDYLAYLAREFHLQDFIKLGKGEILSNVHKYPSILADAFESLIAAIYLDSDFYKAKDFVISFFKDSIHIAVKDQLFIDEKGELQRLSQKYFKVMPVYTVIHSSGRDHDKEFTIEVSVNDVIKATAIGKSKKSAEKSAALIAIKMMKKVVDTDQ